MAVIPKKLNWARDELILALDLYFRIGGLPSSPEHPEVQKLSTFLQTLPLFPKELRLPNFRNPAGVYSKLSNFLAVEKPGAGRPNGGQLDEVVWAEFSNDRARLRSEAEAIWNTASILPSPVEADYDLSASEGGLLVRVHVMRERSRELVRKKKALVLTKMGKLECECCGFDFVAVYGSLGNGFAECHHRKPITQLKAGDKTHINDLAVICANCHRMIHFTNPMLSVEGLREIVRARRGASA